MFRSHTWDDKSSTRLHAYVAHLVQWYNGLDNSIPYSCKVFLYYVLKWPDRPWSHPTPMGTGKPIPVVKLPGHKVYHLPFFVPPLRMSGAIPPVSQTLYWHAQGQLYLLVTVFTGGCSCEHNCTFIVVTHVWREKDQIGSGSKLALSYYLQLELWLAVQYVRWSWSHVCRPPCSLSTCSLGYNAHDSQLFMYRPQ